MMSSVDLLVLYVYWQKSRVDVLQDKSLQALHDYRCQCNWPVIIEGCYNSLLWDWHDCGRLQAGGDSALYQRKVEDITKYIT